MATKKASRVPKKTTRKVAPRRARKEEQTPSLVTDSFRFGDSYTSLILGIVAVIIIIILFIAFIRGRNTATDNEQETSSTNTQEGNNQTYIVQTGDDLWTIAESEYGSGYEWVTIAKENNLANPDLLEEGTKLILPSISATQSAQQQSAVPTGTVTQPEGNIRADLYVVEAGDTLWDIAQRAYGDGYRWVDISRANNLVNPDLIYVGTKLTLPRN